MVVRRDNLVTWMTLEVRSAEINSSKRRRVRVPAVSVLIVSVRDRGRRHARLKSGKPTALRRRWCLVV